MTDHDAVIIGGGFYGCVIAAHLAERHGLRRILVVERDTVLLGRSSYNNQARVHNGYHYPRSHTTALRSRVNLPHFVERWPQAVSKDFTKLYVIARRNSKVTARQFSRFCQEIGADLRPALPEHRSLFEKHLVEEVFQAVEHVFDATVLARWAEQALSALGVVVEMATEVVGVRNLDGLVGVDVVERGGGETRTDRARLVVNCTYSGLNRLQGSYPGSHTPLKHEITEMALVSVPEPLASVGITVMDGPFFSLMPFPPRGLHTLSHVRYTPHYSWLDDGRDPYLELDRYAQQSRFSRMVRDASRYLPLLGQSVQKDSLFEVKTVLVKNEVDDGRPILFEEYRDIPGLVSVLGGKIDNVFDVLARIDHLIEHRKDP